MSPLRALVRRFAFASRSLRRRLRRADREALIALAVAVVSAFVVFAIATTVFQHHSSNHDEGVYLQQAAMLLDGRLELYAGELAGSFRPWFFVADEGRLYPKYTPVPAAMYALSLALFGEPRVTLAAVAAGNVVLVYLLGSTAFDRRVGAVAAAVFAASPLSLVTTSVFLPYAPTTSLNLLFAVAYLRSVRDESVLAAGVAGTAIGLAFFARPYTAVLFAAPFVLHAAVAVASASRRRIGDRWRPLPGAIRRNGTTALLGLFFVAIALAYNARLTGSPLLFPYEAFAPLDGPGFGRRRILGHSIVYTPGLALRANGYLLWYFLMRWFAAGAIGSAFAAAGLLLAIRRWRRSGRVGGRANYDAGTRIDRTAGVLLAGLFLTVPLGNLAFWGNYNALATMTDPTDGLVSQFGPVYHFDLLAPLSVFAAVGVLAGWRATARRVRERLGPLASPRTVGAVAVALLVAGGLLAGAANAALVSAPLERNAAHADRYEAAYEPIEEADFENALVFVPTPYGDWQNHPFQSLRNDPSFDGRVVYALDRDPDDDFAVLDAYPDRTAYRYAYRGTWTADANRHVTPKLEPLDVRRGETLDGESVVGVPDRVDRATVRLEGDDGRYAAYAVDEPGDEVAVRWSMNGETARLRDAGEDASVPLAGTGEVVLTVTLVQSDGSTLTYRQETTARLDGDAVEAVWPPDRSVCPLVKECGNEGTYLPDDPDVHRDDVRFETRLDARE